MHNDMITTQCSIEINIRVNIELTLQKHFNVLTKTTVLVDNIWVTHVFKQGYMNVSYIWVT